MPKKFPTRNTETTAKPKSSLKKKKLRVKVDTEDSADDPAPAGASWLKQGKEQIDQMRNNGGGGNFKPMVPEFFLMDKESVVLKLITPIGPELERVVGRHQYPATSKAGKRYFKAFTCTGSPDTCAGCANGDRTTNRWVLEVLDPRELEYRQWDSESKKSVKVKKSNVAKLWLPSFNEMETFFAALEDFEDDKGEAPQGRLEVKVRRLGSGPKTSYAFTVKRNNVGFTKTEKQAIEQYREQFGTVVEMLAPLPLGEQKKIVGSSVEEEEDVDDNDDEEEEVAF